MDSTEKKRKSLVLLKGEAARTAIEKRIRRLQRRISVTANPKIKKWAEKALYLGRYHDCYWILKIESVSDPQEYEKRLSWLKRIEKTLV